MAFLDHRNQEFKKPKPKACRTKAFLNGRLKKKKKNKRPRTSGTSIFQLEGAAIVSEKKRRESKTRIAHTGRGQTAQTPKTTWELCQGGEWRWKEEGNTSADSSVVAEPKHSAKETGETGREMLKPGGRPWSRNG